MARFIASPCNILKVYINIDVYNMRRTIKVGLIQQSCTGNTAENMDKLKHSIEDVASKGAELVVLQELHNTLYFCQTENTSLFDLAETIPGPSTEFYSGVASANSIVLVTSLFEKRAPGLYHNTAVVFDKDGSIAGKYRKMHIPDDPAYYEKFYRLGKHRYPGRKSSPTGSMGNFPTRTCRSQRITCNSRQSRRA